MSTDFWYVFMLVCGIFLTASSVFGIYKAIRTRVVAGKAGIAKVCVTWYTLIIHLAVCALFTYFGINRMSEAQKYFSLADKAERVIDRLDNIVGDTFQQVSEKTPSESSADIRERIAKYRKIGDANKTYATILLIIAVSDLVSAASAIWYITDEGIMLSSFKVPEPFNAALNGDKIEVNFAAKLRNIDKCITFKATPKNLAAFGKFINWEQEQNPQIPNQTL